MTDIYIALRTKKKDQVMKTAKHKKRSERIRKNKGKAETRQSKGVYRVGGNAQPHKPVRGHSPTPWNSEPSHFSNLKLKSEEHIKLVCCSFSALRRLYT